MTAYAGISGRVEARIRPARPAGAAARSGAQEVWRRDTVGAGCGSRLPRCRIRERSLALPDENHPREPIKECRHYWDALEGRGMEILYSASAVMRIVAFLGRESSLNDFRKSRYAPGGFSGPPSHIHRACGLMIADGNANAGTARTVVIRISPDLNLPCPLAVNPPVGIMAI